MKETLQMIVVMFSSLMLFAITLVGIFIVLPVLKSVALYILVTMLTGE